MGAVVITDHVARWSWNCWYQSSSNSLNNWTRFSWHGVQLVLAEIHDKLYRQIIFNSLKKIPWYQGVIHQRFFYLNENTFQLVCLRAVTFNTRNYLESKLTAGSSRFLFLSIKFIKFKINNIKLDIYINLQMDYFSTYRVSIWAWGSFNRTLLFHMIERHWF